MDVYVLGVALHPARERVGDKRLEEMVFDTARAALDDAGIAREAIDHVTIAASDELDGRSISSMLLAAPAGAYLKDETKCTDSGLVGLCLGALRVESGAHDLGLVVSWNKSSIAPLEDVMRMRAEPYFVRPIGLNMAIADGLFAQAVGSALGFGEAEAAAAAARGHAAAARNPRAVARPRPSEAEIAASAYVAAPLREGHRAPVTDGAVAMVLASRRWLSRRPRARPLARLAGTGWRVDGYDLGGARLSGLESFRASFDEALRVAGRRRAGALDVIELDAQTGFHAVAYGRALDLAAPERLSPSGGAFAQNPYFCTGLANAAEAVLQVSGRAGAVQVAGARSAAAHGSHGFAQQGHAVAVFEAV